MSSTPLTPSPVEALSEAEESERVITVADILEEMEARFKSGYPMGARHSTERALYHALRRHEKKLPELNDWFHKSFRVMDVVEDGHGCHSDMVLWHLLSGSHQFWEIWEWLKTGKEDWEDIEPPKHTLRQRLTEALAALDTTRQERDAAVRDYELVKEERDEIQHEREKVRHQLETWGHTFTTNNECYDLEWHVNKVIREQMERAESAERELGELKAATVENLGWALDCVLVGIRELGVNPDNSEAYQEAQTFLTQVRAALEPTPESEGGTTDAS